MAGMKQIVIEISDNKYKSIQSDDYCGILDDELYKAIKEGIAKHDKEAEAANIRTYVVNYSER